MADSDFDLDEATNRAWEQFSERLGEVLSMMDEESQISICSAAGGFGSAPTIKFVGLPGYRLRAEAPDNEQLEPRYRLSGAEQREMAAIGWRSGAEAGIDSAGWVVEGTSDESFKLAGMSVDAFRVVYGVPHPVFLEPDQLSEILQPPPPPLVTSPDHSPAALLGVLPDDQSRLDAVLDREMVNIYGEQPYRDAAGDIAIRVGSTMVFVRSTTDCREVLLFSILVHDVTGRSRAAEVLNDLNVESRFGRFSLHKDKVIVQMSIPARPFVPAHLHQALAIISQIADGIDNELAAKLQGRTTFDATN